VEKDTGFCKKKKNLPRMTERRGFMNLAGSAFNILFGTATIADLENLHRTVDKLLVHENEYQLAHSVNEQITYLTSLDASVKYNTHSVAISTDKVKAVMLNFEK
jgi:hypothetical protein